jgi:tRNA dimethylallyltransferase
LMSTKSEPIPYNIKQFCIAPDDRKELHQRISLRFQLMIDTGFQAEVEKLKNRGDLHLNLPSIRCVGYRQMWQYLDGNYDFNEMFEKSVAATRPLPKRQFTGVRGWENIHKLDTFSPDNLSKVIKLS